jgi:integrase
VKLYRRKGSDAWWYKFMVNGVLYRKSTGTSNEREADRIANAVRTDVLRNGAGILTKKDVPTVKEFQKRFTEIVATEVTSATLDSYTDAYNNLVADGSPLANTQLDAVDIDKLAAFKQYAKQKLKLGSNVTINHSLRMLRRALYLAVEQKVISQVPTIKMLEEKGRDFWLKPEDEPKYLEACPPFLRAAAILDLETGCRISELTGLKWSDVNWHARTLHIRGTKNDNSDRKVNLTTRALEVLEEQKAVSKCDYILTSPRWPDRQASRHGLEHAHEVARKKAGLSDDFKFHSLRHTFCTRLAAAGIDATRILKLAGHANLTTSQRYIKKDGIDTEAAMQAFEKHAEKARKSALGTKLGTVPRKVVKIR